MALPDFIIGGAPKAGTTALFRYLSQHPDVFTTNPKEPHYFASAALGRRVQFNFTRSEYEALFANKQPGQVAGEGSTEYLQHDEAVAPALAAAVPNVRLIFSLRDPVERAYSYYWFRLHMGIIGSSMPFSDYRKRPWLLKAGDYFSSLTTYLEHFDSEQILILLAEDLRFNTEATVARVCKHIGVDSTFEFNVRRSHNTTRYPRAPQLTAAAGRIAPGFSRWASRNPVLRPFRSRVLFSRHAKQPPMSTHDRDALIERYRPGVEALAELIGRDLSYWLRPTA